MDYSLELPDNVSVIWDGPAHSYFRKTPIPLVLLHDGGGTTFSYHCLDPTNRALIGVANAHLDKGGYWEGGIPEMARQYILDLAQALPDGGDILLGGWSLGGLLSLEVAHQLATGATVHPTQRKFNVVGMVFVDSVHPKRIEKLTASNGFPKQALVKTVEELKEEAKAGHIIKTPEELKQMKLKEKVDLNMFHARIMVGEWDMPQWKGVKIPPTILLRAREYVSTDYLSFVDLVRDERMLGWDDYCKENGDFITEVWDIEGHHFNIFEEKYISDITAKICAAADALDEPEF